MGVLSDILTAVAFVTERSSLSATFATFFAPEQVSCPMGTYIFVVSDPETGNSYQFEADANLAGRTLGETIDGELIGLSGYTLELTGGSDSAGRPMRADVEGTLPRELLLEGGTGFHPTRDGERRRVTVRGNEIGEETTQLNVVVREYGDQSLEDVLDE